MRVPVYWAESRLCESLDKRQTTVRRFGWSDDSQADAQRHADQRAREAIDKIAAGEPLIRRERKCGYNGADDLPIREEVVDRVSGFVITRNSYGARCLNTPNVFFADIDFVGVQFKSVHFWLSAFAALIGSAILLAATQRIALAALAFIPLAMVSMLVVLMLLGVVIRLRGGNHRIAQQKIESFAEKHSDWHLRVYTTPNGYRVMAMHDVLDPRSEEVAEAFKQLSVDPTYVRMCQKQNCFRARLTAKPWRAGIERRLSRAVWPIEKPDELQSRRDWVEKYEIVCNRFAACRFERALGATNRRSTEAEEVRKYHDDVCQATSDLPLA